MLFIRRRSPEMSADTMSQLPASPKTPLPLTASFVLEASSFAKMSQPQKAVPERLGHILTENFKQLDSENTHVVHFLLSVVVD